MNIKKSLQEHQDVLSSIETMTPQIEAMAEKMLTALRLGGTIFWMGNGGSAADAQHMAAELVGRFKEERRGLASIALTTDSSILTAISNDYGFATVFSRQLEALCCKNDIVVGLSTSGNSTNVLKGIEAAKEAGAFTIGFTGQAGGKLAALVDMCIMVPSTNTARIQEAHMFIGHITCEWLENNYI